MTKDPDLLLSPERPNPARQITRVKHEPRRRVLTVSAVEALTPHMRRIHFSSPDMADFTSLSPDDHIKLFLPEGDGGEVKRDYTPRAFDTAAGVITIDFALHEAGPATAWAVGAQPGDSLTIGGPRGSAIIPDAFDWRMFIGDETALPAIGRQLEEARPGARLITIACVDEAEDIQAIETHADWTAEWLRRDLLGPDDEANVRAALNRVFPKDGAGFVWIAGEARFAKALRAYVNEQLGQPIEWIKASGYWVRDPED
ncbi:MAG TPA: siderophore-interacting protein [Caulobacteraceae bacterium]|nr:siderophore-interacting protein [Caulobacteraceae bacterium]